MCVHTLYIYAMHMHSRSAYMHVNHFNNTCASLNRLNYLELMEYRSEDTARLLARINLCFKCKFTNMHACTTDELRMRAVY
jgi:hypothetical protein